MGWEEQRRGGGDLTNATSKCGCRRDSLTWSRCLVTHTHCVLFIQTPHKLLFFFLSRVLFRLFQGESIPHYRRGELLLFATGSAGKLRALSLVFINGQCRTKKLRVHNRRASEPFHPYSGWCSPFEECIFLWSLNVSVIPEVMLNVHTEASNNVQFSRLLSHQ